MSFGEAQVDLTVTGILDHVIVSVFHLYEVIAIMRPVPAPLAGTILCLDRTTADANTGFCVYLTRFENNLVPTVLNSLKLMSRLELPFGVIILTYEEYIVACARSLVEMNNESHCAGSTVHSRRSQIFSTRSGRNDRIIGLVLLVTRSERHCCNSSSHQHKTKFFHTVLMFF